MSTYTLAQMSLEEFKARLSNPATLDPLSPRFLDDERWLFEHSRQLTERYPDHWVVIYKREVVGTGQGPHGLAEAQEQARQVVKDGESFVTFFLESKPYVY